ncbi:NUDIX domain-containing protein [Lysobacter silvestris]|uniref:NUDIX domain-containing protein n=1 Tax=Solilutibacter silvestris TaxID=1645665 RepID=A0A2K1PY42_9GAMM|nr:CoA pyrophosphatase [Lysobacter silvestris]PNS07693.1 NUDIX domain-containing protein [Lysobacter silvestris]
MTRDRDDDPLLRRLRRVLHPLDALPTGEGANAPLMRAWFGIETFREAAVLIGLVPRDDGWKVLLTLRTDRLRHHGGQVAFPGGARDPGDATAIVTALRETREELDIPAALIHPLGALDPMATVSGFRVTPIIAWIDPGHIAKPDPREVADAFEVSFDALRDPANLGQVEMKMGDDVRHILEYRLPPSLSPHRIWGASAMMLDELRQRLE